ncbi:LexA family protein [Devosia riboflavina]|uniref:LexA family protein n=1 Tax=Devosia riboflavina TaxID=46914 RepID=UPI00068BE44C|nr:hypothetical protein [Devosia riboflavina]
MAGLTRGQQRVLAFIQETIFETGVAPSYEEIGAGLGYASKSVVHRIVQQLVERGAISILPNRTRSIQLLGHHRHKRWVEVPAEPPAGELDEARAAAETARAQGEDPYWVFWQAMLDRYQRES